MFEMLNDLLFIGTRPMLPTSSFNLNVNILAILIIHYVSKNIRGKPVPHAGFQGCGVGNPSHTREFRVAGWETRPTRGISGLRGYAGWETRPARDAFYAGVGSKPVPHAGIHGLSHTRITIAV